MNPNDFSSLPLSKAVQQAVSEMGFKEASPIQALAIPKLLEGADIIGQAQTGTGKTAAFAIPIIEQVNPNNKAIQALILCPTRELALQVTEEFRKISKHTTGIRSMAVYGGQPIARQVQYLKRNPQIIIGTPGRVFDLIQRGRLKLNQVTMAVLDEADEMLNMGFRKSIEDILAKTPSRDRQTVLFSATMPPAILELTKLYQQNAEHLKVKQHDQPIPKVEQHYLEVSKREKSSTLIKLLKQHQFEISLVFCNTKWQVDALVKTMKREGYLVDGLHGGMRQSKRDKIMQGFRKGKTKVLIATDVAARGIDVDDIEAVFNYDLPKEVEFYIHRIGRTGRAGKPGASFTFVEKKDFGQLKKIRGYSNVKMSRHESLVTA